MSYDRARFDEPADGWHHGAPLYHGGAPGLRAGDLIEPQPLAEGRHLVDGCPTCEARRAGKPLDTDPNDPGAVYVTTDRRYAAIFAAGYPRGGLYRVEVDGPMRPTRDDPVPSWATPTARVAAVLDPLVRLTPARLRTELRRYSTHPTDTEETNR